MVGVVGLEDHDPGRVVGHQLAGALDDHRHDLLEGQAGGFARDLVEERIAGQLLLGLGDDVLAAEVDGGPDGERLRQAPVVGVEAPLLVAQDQEAAQPAAHQHRLDQDVDELDAGSEEAGDGGEAVAVLGVELLVILQGVGQRVAALLARQQRLGPAGAKAGAGKLGNVLPAVGGAQVVDTEAGADLAHGGGRERLQVRVVEGGVLGRRQEHPVLVLELLVEGLQVMQAEPHLLGHLFVGDGAEDAAQAQAEQPGGVDPEEGGGSEVDLDRGQGDAGQPQADRDLPAPPEQARTPGEEAGQHGQQGGLAPISLDVEAGPREDGQPGSREEAKLKAEPSAPHGGCHSTNGLTNFICVSSEFV